ncbi:MAG: NAD(P)H-dependent oxidoreductase [Actinobacteria bacterium]|nr:NAD(P)H-dependent oxidoreductase [Actinomycetota bacterium]
MVTAVALNCTLKAGSAPSSTEKILTEVAAQLLQHDVTTDIIRVVNHNVLPGVEKDMGEGDEWPALREKLLAADILVFGTPTWMGHLSSVAARVLERLDAELSETDADGRPILFGKVAVVAVVGNEDGAHKISADLFQALNDVGYTIPAQAVTYWNGEAMHATDYNDLDQTPEKTAATNATIAANAAHLARVLGAENFPA